jgi:hypothetical protein
MVQLEVKRAATHPAAELWGIAIKINPILIKWTLQKPKTLVNDIITKKRENLMIRPHRFKFAADIR